MAKKTSKNNKQDTPMKYYKTLRRDHERLRKEFIALRKLLYGIRV